MQQRDLATGTRALFLDERRDVRRVDEHLEVHGRLGAGAKEVRQDRARGREILHAFAVRAMSKQNAPDHAGASYANPSPPIGTSYSCFSTYSSTGDGSRCAFIFTTPSRKRSITVQKWMRTSSVFIQPVVMQ